MRIIGIFGAQRSGKSAAAEILVANHRFIRLRFADTLKDMLRVLGLTDAQIDGDEKHTPSDLLEGKTPRYAMQMLGTEFGRNLISPDLWVNVLDKKLKDIEAADPDALVVVDDVRRWNEYDLLSDWCAEFWLVDRAGMNTPTPPWWKRAMSWVGLCNLLHESERDWPRFPYHILLPNHWSLDDYARRVSYAVNAGQVATLPKQGMTL